MEITTIQKYIHTSPRKLRLVADMVRKMQPAHALNVLRITNKAAALDLAKALETVLANAKQSGLDAQIVNFKTIEINESLKMRRFRAGTRGRVRPYKKRMSHIKIVLTDEVSNKKEEKIASEKIVVDDSAVKTTRPSKGSKSKKKGKTAVAK